MSQQTQYQKREYKPKELSAEELKKIPDPERIVLVMQPTEPKTPWESVEGKNYNRAHEGEILQEAINFYQQLVAETERGFSHIVIGNYQYSKGSGYIYRSEHKQYAAKGATTSGGPRAAFKARFIQEVFLGTIDEINEKVKDGEWQLSYPAVVLGNKILIVRNK